MKQDAQGRVIKYAGIAIGDKYRIENEREVVVTGFFQGICVDLEYIRAHESYRR